MRRFVLLVILIIVSFRLSAQKGETVFDRYISVSGDTLPFQFYQSSGMDTTKKYPLIIWLHGKGERGNDNSKQMTLIKKWLLDSLEKSAYKSFLLAPQCPITKMWNNYDKTAPQITFDSITPNIQSDIIAILDSLTKNYRVDTSRIYLMGISMGGFGVFDMVTRFPQKFAAAVPICGGADPNQADQLKLTPIWAFHGEKDVVVDKRHTIVAMEKISDEDHKLTKYFNVGHNCWVNAFAESNLLNWIFNY